jgi:transposase
MSQVLRECAIGMLTAGMSTRVVARQFNVNFSTSYFVLENLAVCPTGLTTTDHV